MRILFLNGPNLNLLGLREPGVYGTSTLVEIEKQVSLKAKELGVDINLDNPILRRTDYLDSRGS